VKPFVATPLIDIDLSAWLWFLSPHALGKVEVMTVLLLLILCMGVAKGLVRLLRSKPKRNPFDRMTAADRSHMAKIVHATLSRQPVGTQDAKILKDLFARYAPDLSEDAAFSALQDYLRTHGKKLIAGLPRLEKPSRKGGRLVLARQRRRPDFDVRTDGTTWFGGLPALGDQTWPKDSAGQLMTPLAQIDLSQVARLIDIPNLPQSGSLAFFMHLPNKGESKGVVRYVPNPDPATQPQGPLPAVINHTFGGALLRGEPAAHQRLYPRMAMELICFDHEDDWEKRKAKQDQILGPCAEYWLAAQSFPDCMPPKNQPFNRDSLLRLMHSATASLAAKERLRASLLASNTRSQAEIDAKAGALAQARAVAATGTPDAAARDHLTALTRFIETRQSAIARNAQRLSNMDADVTALAAQISHVSNWARRGDRWPALTEAERTDIAPVIETWTQPGHFGSQLLGAADRVHHDLSNCVDETLKVMAMAEDSVFMDLPAPIRVAIEGPYRLPLDHGCHQMFGQPDTIQGDPDDHDDLHLLLQVKCDQLAGFHWGDNGHLQFWIKPSDLRAGDWDKVFMTTDSH